MTRWVYVIPVQGASRPGLLARVTDVFAQRGISLEEALGTGLGTIVLKFAAGERLQEYLRRRLLRINEVDEVQVHELDPTDQRHVWEFL